MKYSKSDQLLAVKSVLWGDASLRSAAARLGCDHKLVRIWVARYKRFGESGLCPPRKSYRGDFKFKVVRCMEQKHLSLFETAIHFGVPGSVTVRSWQRIYQREGADGLYQVKRKMKKKNPPRQNLKRENLSHEELLKENEYLRAENAYLKKLRALVQERTPSQSGKKQKPSKH